MAIWQITAGQNDGYPLYDNGASTSLALWMPGIELPNKVWRIIHDVNDDYPTLSFDWIETSLFDGIIPVNLWRIVDGINEGYPYQWFQIAVESGYINQGGAVIGSDTDMKNYIDNKDHDGDDPVSKPNDPGKREGKIVGDVVGLGSAARVQSLSGVNYYLLKQTDMVLFRDILWSQSKTFYQALNIINSVGTDTIFNYFSSLRYYPISNLLNYFSSNSDNPSSANVILGNGAVLQGPDGYFSCVVPTTKVYSGVICEWDLSSIPWRQNFLDYSPYSKIVLTLPYCGDIEVDINRIAAYRAVEDLHLYVGVIVDIETGTLTYYGTTAAVGLMPFEQILFEKQVKIAIDLPLSGNDQISQSNAILQSTYKLASTTLQTASSLISSAEKTGKKLALHKAGVGDVASFAASAIQGVMDIGVASAEASLAKRQVPVTTGDINGTMSSTITRQYPVLTFYRQKTANPDNYGHTTGYVCEAALTLNSIEEERKKQGIPHAFTVLSNPDLGDISGATQEELEELMGILTTGFYI